MKLYPHTRTRYVQFGFKGIGPDTFSELIDPAYATNAQNVIFEDGCLTGNIGIDAATVIDGDAAIPDSPSSLDGLFFYKYTTKEGARDDRLVVKGKNGNVYVMKLFGGGEWQKVPNLSLAGKDVQAVGYNFNGRDMLMLCSKDDPLFFIDDMTPLYCGSAPSFSCFEVHSERLFGGVNGAKTRLWFSDDYDPFNWKVSEEEAGYITFDDGLGDIIGLKSFLGYLYIFREYGIFRLTAFGKQSEFSMKRVYADTDRISKNSIAICGGRIIFMAGGRMYDFDGYTVRHIAENLPEMPDGDDMSATFLGGCYLLACKSNTSVDPRRIVRYEVGTGQFSYISGLETAYLLAVKTGGVERVYVGFTGDYLGRSLGMISKSGMLMGMPSQKIYAYAQSTLGTAKQKTVKSVTVVADEPMTLTVVADGKNYSYELRASVFVQRLIVGAKGRRIGLILRSERAKAAIMPITMEIEVHGG